MTPEEGRLRSTVFLLLKNFSSPDFLQDLQMMRKKERGKSQRSPHLQARIPSQSLAVNLLMDGDAKGANPSSPITAAVKRSLLQSAVVLPVWRGGETTVTRQKAEPDGADLLQNCERRSGEKRGCGAAAASDTAHSCRVRSPGGGGSALALQLSPFPPAIGGEEGIAVGSSGSNCAFKQPADD
ncbi:hypothetical protein AOLI_G00292630 [Acnodon oligacanthus]